jgi:hypothetical protein
MSAQSYTIGGVGLRAGQREFASMADPGGAMREIFRE